MTALFSDENTYVVMKKNPLNKLRKGVYSFFEYLNDNDLLKFKYHKNQLTQTDASLAKTYGLIELHELGNFPRPIISMVNCPTHKLSSILYDNLKDCFEKPASHINNSF